MGKYDVPAMLNKITEVSGTKKVSYVGYSQGTSQMFYALATNEKKIADKLDRAIMMAPCIVPKPADEGVAMHVKIYDLLHYEGAILMNDKVPEATLAKVCKKVKSGDKYPQESYDMACEMHKSFQGLAPWPIKSWETYG